MAEERDDQDFGGTEGSNRQQPTGQQSQQKEFGQQGQQSTDQGSEGSFGGQRSDSQSGQPIGGTTAKPAATRP